MEISNTLWAVMARESTLFFTTREVVWHKGHLFVSMYICVCLSDDNF